MPGWGVEVTHVRKHITVDNRRMEIAGPVMPLQHHAPLDSITCERPETDPFEHLSPLYVLACSYILNLPYNIRSGGGDACGRVARRKGERRTPANAGSKIRLNQPAAGI